MPGVSRGVLRCKLAAGKIAFTKLCRVKTILFYVGQVYVLNKGFCKYVFIERQGKKQ